MEHLDSIPFVPSGPYTIVNNETEYLKEKEATAKKLGKKVEELTEEEREDAWETFKAGHGLCDLDFLIP